MPEVNEEDKLKFVPVPLKSATPAIPKKESKMKELVEDLTRMDSEGLLSIPWNMRSKAILREFLFENGN